MLVFVPLRLVSRVRVLVRAVLAWVRVLVRRAVPAVRMFVRVLVSMLVAVSVRVLVRVGYAVVGMLMGVTMLVFMPMLVLMQVIAFHKRTSSSLYALALPPATNFNALIRSVRTTLGFNVTAMRLSLQEA